MRRLTRGVALAAAAALLLGACGGGDDDDSEASSGTTGTTTSTTAAEDTSDSTESQGGIIDSARLAQRCTNYTTYAATVGLAMAAAVDPSAAKQLEEFKDKADLADAPDEIKDDFEVLVDYAEELGAVLAKYPATGGTYNPQAIAALTELAQEIDQERLEDASENIQAWLSENCS